MKFWSRTIIKLIESSCYPYFQIGHRIRSIFVYLLHQHLIYIPNYVKGIRQSTEIGSKQVMIDLKDPQ